MELMDWKQIETGAEEQIRNGNVSMVIGNVMLEQARIQIKKLGGKTNEELRVEASGTSKE